MRTNSNHIKSIIQYLFHHGFFSPRIGFLDGKMGISFFFFQLHKETGEVRYYQFACDLIDMIYEEISEEENITFADGLSGIAWAFDYFIKHQFLNADIDSLLEDIDLLVIQKDIRYISDLSFFTGIKGIAYYIISRYSNKNILPNPYKDSYIADLLTNLKQNSPMDEFSLWLLEQLSHIQRKEPVRYSTEYLDDLIYNCEYDMDNLFTVDRELGIINNGYTGIGLNLLQIIKHEKQE